MTACSVRDRSSRVACVSQPERQSPAFRRQGPAEAGTLTVRVPRLRGIHISDSSQLRPISRTGYSCQMRRASASPVARKYSVALLHGQSCQRLTY